MNLLFAEGSRVAPVGGEEGIKAVMSLVVPDTI